MGMRFGGGMSCGKPDETTTITIDTFKSDRNRLNHLGHYPREPYRAIVRRLLDQSGDPQLRSPGHSPASRHRLMRSGGASL